MPEASSAPRSELIAGRYRVERLLGRGGMGSVYAVVDTADGRLLALKQLTVGASSTMLGLFEREYQTLASLRHPSIVEVYDYGSDAGGVYYTMELLAGSDLRKQAPMGWRDACACLRDAAVILGLLHTRRLVHRDLSPNNLWRLPNGALKIIDFGAVAPFSSATEIVGTPPFIAPEALRRAELDQRADLFSLGALGYWLITGVHAFPASELSALPALHARTPARPSELLAASGQRSLEPVPAELDDLLAMLLRIEPRERPLNTAELIDRLQALTELEPELTEQAAQAYIASKVFVGRERERLRTKTLLDEVRDQNTTRAISIEGEQEVGRTRLLRELAVLARLSGAVTLTADARCGDEPYSVAAELLVQLLHALPEATRRAARPHAAELARVSAALREQLGVQSSPRAPEPLGLLRTQGDQGGGSTRLQEAFEACLLEVGRERLICILVDDMLEIDDSSKRLLAALALERPSKLLLIGTTKRADDQPVLPAIASFRQVATRLHLLPLTAAETFELLRSVFGDVPYLERCTERLQRVSGGNPGHCLELAQHLIDTGAARYAEGTWILSAELDHERLPTRHEAHVGRLALLSPRARALARALSIPHDGPLSLPHCLLLGELEPDVAQIHLAELCAVGVLLQTPRGYRFAHDDVRDALQLELEPSTRTVAHRKLGEALRAAAGDDPLEQLRASVHLLRAGDLERGREPLKQVGRYYEAGDMSNLRAAAPLLEEAYRLLQALGADKYALAMPLAMLTVAGYFVDRRYGRQYGDVAINLLEQILRMHVVRRLQTYLGKKLALLVALFMAWVSLLRRRSYAPSLKGAITELLGAVSALNATASVYIDAALAERYGQRLEPFVALGPNHVAGVLYNYTMLLSWMSDDHCASGRRKMKAMLARLESAEPIREMTPTLQRNFLAGLYVTLGAYARWLDTGEILRYADQLEPFGPFNQVYADQLRWSHFAGRGETERAELYRKRLERHAVQLETSWQVETWAPATNGKLALWSNDALLMKRTAQELGRLSPENPALDVHARRARGAYLVMRGKYERALPLLETGEEPGAVLGWAYNRGWVARAHRGLGNFAQARDVCRDALEHLTQEDLEFVFLNLHVQIELALAEAGLGNLTLAAAQLGALIAQHTSVRGALPLGALHAARTEVALLEGDLERAGEHLTLMRSYFEPTGLATLIELVDRLTRKLQAAEQARWQASSPRQPQDADTRLQAMESRSVVKEKKSIAPSERISQSLQLAIELAGADSAFLLLSGPTGTALSHLGPHAPEPGLVAWAQRKLEEASVDAATVLADELDSVDGASYVATDGRQYAFAVLWEGDEALGAIALGFEHRTATAPGRDVLQGIVRQLRG